MRAILLVSAVVLCACSNDASEQTVTIDDLPEASEDGGVWESQPWASDNWIDYPGRVTLVVHHDLGRTPRSVLVYLSFAEDGTDASLAAGDLARVVDLDDETLTIENHSNADLFARIVLQ